MPSLYFDKQDHLLLAMVNRMLESDSGRDKQIFAKNLHPHGIKELALPREMRIAHTVINLLHSLEEGQAADRIHALATLYDEVVSVTDSTFRYNTGRALIQIMKELIRTEEGTQRRLILAHTFRKTARGNRRFVRQVLKSYNLLEMPEEWTQVAFDHHVHDAHTKGRKTPSHLIMDAWIKGIRKVTVIYYNYVEAHALTELFQAAKIMGIDVQIGIEYRAIFRNRQITFIWEPPSLTDIQFLESFLKEEPVRALMQEGKEASRYYLKNVLTKLEQYNTSLRQEISTYFGVELKEISENKFMRFVGSGQASLLHLADLVYKEILTQVRKKIPDLRAAWAKAIDQEVKDQLEAQVAHMQDLTPEKILQKWFIAIPHQGPTVVQPPELPALLRTPAQDLVRRLNFVRRKSNITLTTAKLSPEDVLELLYHCQGRITHLELFNLKDFAQSLLTHQEEINALQFAINQGSAIVLKKLITDIIEQYRQRADHVSQERLSSLLEILYNIPRLQFYYRDKPIKTRIGSDATSRSSILHGMGFVYMDTLPPAAIKELKKNKNSPIRMTLPLKAEMALKVTYTPKKDTSSKWAQKFLTLIRKIPGLGLRGYKKSTTWKPIPETVKYNKNAQTFISLGGLKDSSIPLCELQPASSKKIRPGIANINTILINVLKVSIGFALAAATFSITQDWWFMALFGAPIWFIITGARNIVQAVLAGRGFKQSSLLHWRDYISWTRISDSLLFTGISVPLLELILRWGILGKLLGMSVTDSPMLFFVIISTVNGLYIAGHNAWRGLQKEAIIGNVFRSVLAVPLSLLYNGLLVTLLTPLGPIALIFLADSAAIVSKAASDTVAGIIEGFADRGTNLSMRKWDYTYKLKQLFSCYAQLDVLLPEQDTLEILRQQDTPLGTKNTTIERLQLSILIHSLDLMYFLLYQPRAKAMLQYCIQAMSAEEKKIFTKAQLILTKERMVSQALINGVILNDFARVLAFYLNRYEYYLQDISQLTKVPIELKAPMT